MKFVFLNCFSCVLCNIVCRVVLLAIVLHVLRCQSLATCRWFYPVSSNKTGHHDISEILLKVALNTINQPTLLFTACGYPFGFFKRFSSHHVTSVPHDHEYLFVYILTFVKEPIEHVILISCNIAVLYTGIVVQLSSLTKRLNKRSIAESNLI